MEALHVISVFFVMAGVVSAIIVALDLVGRRQPMKIMNAVWVLTALWGTFPALWAYYSFGRAAKPQGDMMAMQDSERQMPSTDQTGSTTMDMPTGHAMHAMPENRMMPTKSRPHWQSVTVSTLHCGAGCTLADIIGEWFLFFVPVAIAGNTLAGSWTLDYILALLIGLWFQSVAIREMESISIGKAVGRAFKADFFSLTAWQAGMYGWMAIVIFVFFSGNVLPRTSWTFWFMMQVAMSFGFMCAYPVNRWLIRAGIKKGM